MEKRKRLTGESAEKCFARYRDIKDNPMYSDIERTIAYMWLVKDMTPKQISESGQVISKRNNYMSDDMVRTYINKLFPDIEYLEKPNQCKRTLDKLHSRNMWYLKKGLKGSACAICGKPAQIVDHIVPVAAGGSDNFDNIQYLCRECHKVKTNSERVSGTWYQNISQRDDSVDIKAELNKQLSIFDGEDSA